MTHPPQLRSPDPEIIKVLLLEGTPRDADLVRLMLDKATGASFQLECTERLSEGLARLNAGDIHVILLDLSLPDSQGLATLAKVHAHAPRLPIVVLTGLDDRTAVIESLRAGAQDYLVKGQVQGNLLERALRYAIERKAAESRLRFLKRLLRMLSETNQFIVRVKNVDALFAEVCRIAVQRGEFRMAWIGLLDFETGLLRLVAAAGFEDGYLPEADLHPEDSPCRRGPAGTAIREGRTVIVQDMENEPSSAACREAAAWRGYRSAAAFPIVKDEKVIGAFTIMAADPDVFDSEVVDLLEELVADVNYALQAIEADNALRESEQRFRATFEQAAVGIAHIGATGRWLRVNQRFCDIVGYTREELLERSFQDINHPDDVDADIESARRLLAGDIQTYSREKRYARKDGSHVWINLTLSLVRESSGDPKYFISVVEDISGRKRTEEALRASEELYRHSQKMEAVGRLAGGVAHDFNNILTAIMGYSYVLETELGEGHPLRDAASDIRKAAERAAVLTRQLLAFSRKQVLVPEILDLNAVVANLDKMLRRVIREDIELTLALEPRLGRVKADPGQIEQVIMNLAVNSRDAMPTGGQLIIETRNLEIRDTGLREHMAVPAGSYVRVAVSDTGVGMDAETKSHLFEPFFTTKETGKGTGLGLATVYGIVKQSDGHIWVHSEPGKGARFVICLPRVEEQVAGPNAGVQSTTENLGGVETILLVEDDEPVRDLVSGILRSHGYAVLVASSPLAALDAAASHPGGVHLLVADVVTPGMSGPELAALVASRYPGVKVLFISGYPDVAMTHHGLSEYGAAFLAKPFTPRGLARKVRTILDEPTSWESAQQSRNPGRANLRNRFDGVK